jgi:XTP/dITP diphosphohydrolase
VVEPIRLVLATGNPGKIRELTDLLGDRFTIEPRPMDLAETVEDGKTLLENATKKAVEVFAHSGAMALADDTGLFVKSLGGKPGVRSARYAGRRADDAANRARLLTELASVRDGPDSRRAYFETVVVVVGAPTGTAGSAGDEVDGAGPRSGPEVTQLVPLVGRGRVYGHVVTEERGGSGFGYDALFQPDGVDGRTFAEMSLAEKQAISHRSRALAQVREQLERLFETGQ